MTREVWVLEEHSDGEGWYPTVASDSRDYVESEQHPKRIVRYVPAQEERETMTTDERIASIRVGNTRVYPTVNQDDVAFLLAELDAANQRASEARDLATEAQARVDRYRADRSAALAQRDAAIADAEAEGHAAEAAQKDIWALKAELDAARARAATLREVLEQLVHAIDAHQAQAWATSDIDTSAARAVLAAGEDTRG